MKISYENKVALITGAASGLGLATAQAFAEAGAAVVMADSNEKAVQSAAKEITAKGHKTLAIRCDVADDGEVEAMVKQTVATFDGWMPPITMPAYKMFSLKPLTLLAMTMTGSWRSIYAACGVV